MVVLLTTLAWVIVMYLTPSESDEVLTRFYKKTTPGGPGWKRISSVLKANNIETGEGKWSVPQGVLAMVLGCFFVYGCLFATGNWIYGNYTSASWITAIAIISGFILIRVWRNIKTSVL